MMSPILFLIIVALGIAAGGYIVAMVTETFIRPRVAARRARRYGAKR